MAVTLSRWPDPCGIFCALLTYACVGYAEYACLAAVILPGYSGSGWWRYLHASLYTLDILFLLAAHTRALLADPGVVPLPATAIDFSDIRSSATRNGAELASESWTVCNRCEAYRPPRAHHCRVCQRCIRRMDHHCPWINNCVGELNQKYFIQFLVYTGIASIYALLLVLAKLVTSGKEKKPEEEAESQASVAHTIVLLVESLLFGIFVIVILYDQLMSVLADETAVEQLMKQASRDARRPRRRSGMAVLREVFGRGYIALWLCPCDSPPSETGTARHRQHGINLSE
ncbi:palmitoyltransferase ZDHHC3-like isoform X1 [Petromyzon marinus]|uniref:palmitoyltransferase ZDHHC3-like isoform X1 n=1 Tax=Petromyzon marinus TaxID=7757 RepID=UPI003F72D26B